MDIRVLDIEMNHVGEIFAGREQDVRRLLGKAGYRLHTVQTIDHIYVKEEE